MRFQDRNGQMFSIVDMTYDFAGRNAQRLARVHNAIPFQYWTPSDVMSEADCSREYYGKWQISRVALCENELIGLCIGFELRPDGLYYHKPGVYIHRLAVDEKHRNRGIGAILHAQTVESAFGRNLQYVGDGPMQQVYEQTNDTTENARVVRFYLDAGAQVIGRKPYPERIDLILGISETSFRASRHETFRAAQALD